MVVTSRAVSQWRDADERGVEASWCLRLARRAGMNGLAVLGADPMRDEGDVSEGEHLGKNEQAANGRASPLSRLDGSCSRSEQEPMHALFLTPRFSKVKARSRRRWLLRDPACGPRMPERASEKHPAGFTRQLPLSLWGRAPSLGTN